MRLVNLLRAASTLPELTATRYGTPRGAYARLSVADEGFFRSVMGSVGVVTDEDVVAAHNTDWLKTCRGQSQLVLRPHNAEETAAVLRYCNERHLAVIPQGGNTGLVGGSVAVHDEIVLSTSRMNKFESVDRVSGIAVTGAGVTLQALSEELAQNGHVAPLDLGAKGSCHIGGNVATNAGGIRLLRYGSLRGSVLGLEVVTAKGEVLDLLKTNRKDNTGYDLTQLFIGSEGTLGLITRVALLCPPLLGAVNVALLATSSYENVLKIFQRTKRHCGEILSAFEFMDAGSLNVVQEKLGHKCPVEAAPFYVLLETTGSSEEHDAAKLDGLLTDLLESGLADDGTMAADVSKQRELWSLREEIALALATGEYVYKYDVSLPLSCLYQLVEDMRQRLGDKALRCVGYGHVGDGNLHLNVTTSQYDPEVRGLIEPFVYDWVRRERGSISAEHGIGFLKKKYLHYSKPDIAINYMRAMKHLFDPNSILNPYKMFT